MTSNKKGKAVYWFSIIMIFLFIQCNVQGKKTNRCSLIPESGPCKALFTKYYYDKTEKKCKEFNWGGCEGVVPFETLEECQKECNCK